MKETLERPGLVKGGCDILAALRINADDLGWGSLARETVLPHGLEDYAPPPLILHRHSRIPYTFGVKRACPGMVKGVELHTGVVA